MGLTIGSSPTEEDCAQVGSADFSELSRLECQLYKEALQLAYPPPTGAYFAIKSFPHDYGTCQEVCAVYSEDSEEAVTWAFMAEDGLPTWSDDAKNRLAKSLSKC